MAEILREFLHDGACFVALHLPWLAFGLSLVLLLPGPASRACGWASSLERWCWRLVGERRPAGPPDLRQVLDDAARCEAAGDWDHAIALLRRAGGLLRGTPGATRVEDDIKRIEKKRERARRG